MTHTDIFEKHRPHNVNTFESALVDAATFSRTGTHGASDVIVADMRKHAEQISKHHVCRTRPVLKPHPLHAIRHMLLNCCTIMKHRLTMILFASTLALLSCGQRSPSHDDPLARFAHDYKLHYPHAEVQDLYKTLYQEHFGPGHIIPSRVRAQERLEAEIQRMSSGGDEALFSYCGPSRSMIQLNLRPALAAGISADTILMLMFESMERLHTDTVAFLQVWDHARSLARDGILPWGEQEFEEFESQLPPSGLAVIHHSVRYMENYAPAYRVVLTEVFNERYTSDANRSP